MKRHLVHSVSCDHHLQVQNIPLPPKDTPSLRAVTPHPVPPAPVDPQPASVSMDLPVLDLITHDVALCLASLTQHNVFQVHPPCSTCHGSFLFMAEHDSAILCTYPYFNGHWSSFDFLAITDSAAMSIPTVS